MLIDTHAHLNFNAFKEDADDVIRRSLSNSIWMINVGSQYLTSRRAVEIANKYKEGVYAAVGLHPIHVGEKIPKKTIDPQEIVEEAEGGFDFSESEYKKLAISSKKVVAIGEIGLDYYYKPKTKIRLKEFKERQKETLEKQIGLARELGLPVIFHCRMAHEDLLEFLNDQPRRGGVTPHGGFTLPYKGGAASHGGLQPYKLNGVIHCFSGTREQARRYLEMGFYLGFNGIIFKLKLDEVIEETPLGKILIETDCPYLTPPIGPLSGPIIPLNGMASQQKGLAMRNEPAYLRFIAEQIAKIKKMSYEEIADITTKNARELFRI